MVKQIAWVALAAGASAVLTGCGMPGAPQPPSLNLPERVTNLTATRTGGKVVLAWTMPKRDTDKLLLKGSVTVHLCRKEGAAACVGMGDVQLAGGEVGAFTEMLPAELSKGAWRPLTYFVELKNHGGRSAGVSNAATVVAGAAPLQVTGLRVEMHREGVAVHWTAATGEDARAAIRLQRRQLVVAGRPKANTGILAAQAEPLQRSLLVEAGAQGDAGRALDKEIQLGESYEYRAQRVSRVEADGKTLELVSDLSEPVRIEAKNLFPPMVPTGVAAVASIAEAGPSIDLSWQPDIEVDLAGYVVYRREVGGEWQRISGATPLAVPAFHDTQVVAGHGYVYAVTAVGQNGRESVRSAEAQETVSVQ